MTIDNHAGKKICDQLDRYMIAGKYRAVDRVLKHLRSIIPEEEYRRFDRMLGIKLDGRRTEYNNSNSQKENKIERMAEAIL